ncbi:MAG: hypothetical protein AAF497_03060 [Planctomycetota bacterium]
MLELKNDSLVFSFPDVHPAAQLRITFQRTLRIPDDGRTYPLPPGLGEFPLRHIDDFEQTVPASWLSRGGVIMPMYQSEAMWLHFQSDYIENQGQYPFVVKIATGKINAVSGMPWKQDLNRQPQDYLAIPTQPWLDGYCVEKGVIRQFVAMPLGQGFSAEEQITGHAEFGGLQIMACPMKRAAFEKHFPIQEHSFTRKCASSMDFLCEADGGDSSMGLAPGGQMRQEIYEDPYQLKEWDVTESSRCFVHLANSEAWRSITGKNPPTRPVTAKDYTKAGLPWFEYYGDPACTVEGSKILNGLKSVAEKLSGKSELSDNESVSPKKIIVCPKDDSVRDGEF